MFFDYTYFEELALNAGFDHCAKLNKDGLIFRPEVREMCSADKCNNYGKSWSCPPALPSLQDVAKKAEGFSEGILVQTTGLLRDEFDMESIEATATEHMKHWSTYVRQFLKINPAALPMSSGGCRICHKCTYPGSPCRYPSKVFPSMEAYGLWVSDVCEKSGLKYYYGPKTMTFTACILYNLQD